MGSGETKSESGLCEAEREMRCCGLAGDGKTWKRRSVPGTSWGFLQKCVIKTLLWFSTKSSVNSKWLYNSTVWVDPLERERGADSYWLSWENISLLGGVEPGRLPTCSWGNWGSESVGYPPRVTQVKLLRTCSFQSQGPPTPACSVSLNHLGWELGSYSPNSGLETCFFFFPHPPGQ